MGNSRKDINLNGEWGWTVGLEQGSGAQSKKKKKGGGVVEREQERKKPWHRPVSGGVLTTKALSHTLYYCDCALGKSGRDQPVPPVAHFQ